MTAVGFLYLLFNQLIYLFIFLIIYLFIYPFIYSLFIDLLVVGGEVGCKSLL